MELLIIISVVVALFILGVYPICRIESREQKELVDNTELIKQKMNEAKTVDDCIALQKEISDYYRNVKSMSKNIRTRYQAFYNMVDGMKYIIEKQSEV